MMPSAVLPNPRAGVTEPDDLDRLFEYDDAVNDFLKDLPLNTKETQANTTTAEEVNPAKNIDEEITVRKQRKPVPKLDENLLLGPNGLSRLRKITKSRLRFRGKGHEFADVGRLLNIYQLWLDDLYPRAKFRDALGMVEKVGHRKRMEVMRRAWLDETKAGRSREDQEMERIGGTTGGDEDATMSGGLGKQDGEAIFGRAAPQPQPSAQSGMGHDSNDIPDDDELDILLAESATTTSVNSKVTQQRPRGAFEEDEPDEEELDSLLEERNATINPAAPSRRGPFEEDDELDDDALDALLAEEKLTVPPQNTAVPARVTGDEPQGPDDFAEEEAILAEMEDMW